jgi:hypothetical protein
VGAWEGIILPSSQESRSSPDARQESKGRPLELVPSSVSPSARKSRLRTGLQPIDY